MTIVPFELTDAAVVKVEQTQRHGAEVILEGDGFDGAKAYALEQAVARGLTLVHPYDDEKIIAGP